MIVKHCAVSLLVKPHNTFIRHLSTAFKDQVSKEACLYITSTRRNVFCTALNNLSKRTETSCSLRVPSYESEHNERENLFKRGLLLGELLGERLLTRGYRKVLICLGSGNQRGKKGVIRGLTKSKLQVSSIRVIKGYPHNGCRPAKARRKKIRTRPTS